MVEVNSSKANVLIGSLAAVAVFVTILYMGMFNTGKYSPDITTSINEQQNVLMPDSSKIFLNSNSSVKYHCNKFTGNRNVVLAGEAFFEVKGGKKFKVDFEGGSILAKGTQFNVIAYCEDYIGVDCIDGSIDFNYGRYSVTLGKGQGIRVFRGIITGPYSIDTENKQNRLKGLYSWERVSVEEILYLIGRKYDYEINVDRNAGKRNFTGKIDLSDLQNGLNVISYAMDLDYIVDNENQTITVHAK